MSAAPTPQAASSRPAARYRRTVLGTCCLPWCDDGRLDEPLFRRSIGGLIAAGLKDLYVFGTAGEGHSVTESDFRRVVEIFVGEMADGGAPPMVGVIALSLPTVLERIAFAASLGVRVIQFSLPNWGTMTEGEVRRFFVEICGSFPDLEFLHYNLMRTGRLIRPQEYAELAEAHPNLVATKYGAGDPETIAGLLAYVPQLRHFFTEPGFYVGAPLGECALLASISACNPKRAWEYFRAGESGDSAPLTELYRELAGIMLAIRRAAGPGLTDGAYDKLVSKLALPEFPLRLLPPYQSSTDEGFAAYRRELAARFPAWLAA